MKTLSRKLFTISPLSPTRRSWKNGDICANDLCQVDEVHKLGNANRDRQLLIVRCCAHRESGLWTLDSGLWDVENSTIPVVATCRLVALEM